MSMLSQTAARSIVQRLSPRAPTPRTQIWGGEGRYTVTGGCKPAAIAYWRGRELRCHSLLRPEWRLAEAAHLDAPAHIARGGVYFSHTNDDGVPVAFASEERP